MSRAILAIASLSLVASFAACEKPVESRPPIVGEKPEVGVKPAPPGAETPGAEVKKATSSDTATEVPATARDVIADVNKAADPGYTAADLKTASSSLSVGKLQEIGDKLVATIKEKLTDPIALKGLKDKLQVVVDALKAKGIDVSKYTAFLS